MGPPERQPGKFSWWITQWPICLLYSLVTATYHYCFCSITGYWYIASGKDTQTLNESEPGYLQDHLLYTGNILHIFCLPSHGTLRMSVENSQLLRNMMGCPKQQFLWWLYFLELLASQINSIIHFLAFWKIVETWLFQKAFWTSPLEFLVPEILY